MWTTVALVFVIGIQLQPLSATMLSTKARRSADARPTIFTESTTATTNIHCAVKCAATPGCLSYGYSATERSCRLVDQVLSGSTLEDNVQWKYYVVVEGPSQSTTVTAGGHTVTSEEPDVTSPGGAGANNLASHLTCQDFDFSVTNTSLYSCEEIPPGNIPGNPLDPWVYGDLTTIVRRQETQVTQELTLELPPPGDRPTDTLQVSFWAQGCSEEDSTTGGRKVHYDTTAETRRADDNYRRRKSKNASFFTVDPKFVEMNLVEASNTNVVKVWLRITGWSDDVVTDWRMCVTGLNIHFITL